MSQRLGSELRGAPCDNGNLYYLTVICLGVMSEALLNVSGVQAAYSNQITNTGKAIAERIVGAYFPGCNEFNVADDSLWKLILRKKYCA